ncbi:MAG: glycoside hydrolase family 2 TIM barrel-domain containing protein [Desulfobacteraceae bacterium]
MNIISVIIVSTLLCLICWGQPCEGSVTAGRNATALSAGAGGPQPVEIIRNGDAFQLHRSGKPYFIKGIGGSNFLESAAASGANSVRTWGAQDADPLLDRAHALDMTVTLGIWLSHDPADYEDPAYRDSITEEVRDLVQGHKSHPALLFWALGNEINLEDADTVTAWTFIDTLARMIKSLDPFHPVITVVACIPTTLELIQAFAPSLDAVGVNSYGTLAGLRAMVDASTYTGPYLITEWGVTGHWEAQKTLWGRPIEPTSAWKSEFQISRYRLDIMANRDRCIGSYVFLWGFKQERTPTWYSMYLDDLPGGEGLASPMVDAMQFNWTGRWPDNRAPKVSALHINGVPAEKNIVLNPGDPMVSQVEASDPEDDPLIYVWELLREPVRLSKGGSHEERPARMAGMVQNGLPSLNLKAPLAAGEYRLFVYVLDRNGHAATANVPFQVRPGEDRNAVASGEKPDSEQLTLSLQESGDTAAETSGNKP